MLPTDPLDPHNVDGALRATAIVGGRSLVWAGDRVPSPELWPQGARLPREERTPLYRSRSSCATARRPPEDDSVSKHVLGRCHRFLRIPSALRHERTPLNLAAAVNAVLYDRLAKGLLDDGAEQAARPA